jgi:hypothetical protein
MRSMMIPACLAALVALAACGEQEAAAPPPKKELGRPDQAYAGEEKLQSITSGGVERGDKPGELVLKGVAVAPGEGYTRPYFLPWIYPARPADGVYNVDVLAARPATPGAAVPTELRIEGVWNKYADDRVKGVRFKTRTNDLVAMLPPKTAP